MSFAEELHTPVSKKFNRQRVDVCGIDEILPVDFIDMQAFSKYYKGIKYLLTVIDEFPKFVWIIPLKRKTGQEVANTFLRISKERIAGKMWIDQCQELYNKDVKKLFVLYSAEN